MSWNHPVEDLDFISAVWADAYDIDPTALAHVLNSANALCVAYAPPLAEGEEVPGNYILAEIFQARHIWASFQGANDQTIGADGYEISTNTWNLVLQARDLLRPKQVPIGRIY